jgi:putative heme-binding domain-containing protein
LIEQTIAMGDAEAIDHLATLVCLRSSSLAAGHRFRSLATLLDGLSARKLTFNTLAEFSRQSIVDTIEHARAAAADQNVEVPVRTAAVRLLGREPRRREDDFALMRKLLVPQSPVDVQRAVVTCLATQSESVIAEILLDGWSSHSPELRNLILDVVARRSSWAESLRQRLASQTIHASELSTPVRQRLLELGGNAAQWQQALAVKASLDRAQVLRDFRPALQLAGDAQRGGMWFRKLCITCHKVGSEGHDVGPQLASMTDKSPATLLNAILDPNAAVDAKYFNYTIVTSDGQVFSGRLETETGSSITLLAAEGKRTTILRRDIEELQASARSVMPDGLERELTPQDLADLIQFVRLTFD